MKNLLKSDFYRARKDKVLFIGLMVTIGLVLMQVLLSKAMLMASSAASDDAEQVGGLLGTTGLALWSNGVSILGNTTQMLIPIFLTIFIVKEFSDRTIRNKLILGYSRSQIYGSILIVHAVISLVYYFGASSVGLLFGCLLFGLGATFNAEVFGMIVVGFIIQFLLSYVLIGFAIIFAINKQSLVLGILLPIAIGFVISIFGLVAILNVNQTFTKVLSFFNFYQANELQQMVHISELTMTTWIEQGEDIRYALPLTPLARILITTPIAIILEIVIGYFRFNKVQFK